MDTYKYYDIHTITDEQWEEMFTDDNTLYTEDQDNANEEEE